MQSQFHRRGNVGPASRKAAAAVEMAFVLPIVMLFALAATDFGRVAHAYSVVSNAARCGAEYASMHSFTPFTRSSWEHRVRETAVEEMQGLGAFDENKLEVAVDAVRDADGLFRAAVAVSYPFDSVVAWPGLPARVVLEHRVEMRQIQ